MSDTEWRISGAAGTPDGEGTVRPRDQVITQGIGFPLRPIDGVPLKDTGDVFNPEQGLFMSFMGGYVPGVLYAKGSVVVGSDFQVVANKLTLDYPFPISTSPPEFALPAFTPLPKSNTSTVLSGHEYTFLQAAWVKRLRFWVPEVTNDTSYRAVIQDFTIPEDPITTIIGDLVLVAGAWTVVQSLNTLTPAGAVFRIGLESLNSGAETNVTGGWTWGGATNNVPIAQTANRTGNHRIVRVDKTDLDGTPRETELLSVIPGSILTIVETLNSINNLQYRVTTTTDSGAYINYDVTLLSQGVGNPTIGQVATLTFDIPIALPTKYSEEVGGVGTPTWASIEGFLTFDNVTQGGVTANAYGVDIEAEPADISEDWNIITYTGA